MDRRTYISTVMTATGIGLAGCAQEVEQPTISDVWVEDTTLKAEIGNPELAEQVLIQVEDSSDETATVSEEDPIVSYELDDREDIGTENQTLMEGSDITFVTVDEEGEEPRSETWTFRTDIEITDVTHPSEHEYESDTGPTEATPIFEITNNGTGPGRIEEIVILRFNEPAELQGENENAAFAETVLANDPNDDIVTPVDGYDGDKFFLPAGESVKVALNGLLTVSNTPVEEESVTQRLTTEIRWLFDDVTNDINLELSGDITQAGGNYYFEDFELEDIDDAGPLN